jgi:hypothetical protein
LKFHGPIEGLGAFFNQPNSSFQGFLCAANVFVELDAGEPNTQHLTPPDKAIKIGT